MSLLLRAWDERDGGGRIIGDEREVERKVMRVRSGDVGDSIVEKWQREKWGIQMNG